jgi:hypothetical protein
MYYISYTLRRLSKEQEKPLGSLSSSSDASFRAYVSASAFMSILVRWLLSIGEEFVGLKIDWFQTNTGGNYAHC